MMADMYKSEQLGRRDDVTVIDKYGRVVLMPAMTDEQRVVEVRVYCLTRLAVIAEREKADALDGRYNPTWAIEQSVLEMVLEIVGRQWELAGESRPRGADPRSC